MPMEVGPRIQDWVLGRLDSLRARALAEARGEVLEVGFGTGRNLAHYPAGVAHLTALDPAGGLERRVAERIEAAPFPVTRHARRADERMPFDDARFDCVVTTWTLCSIPDAPRALAEMRRVLKPGGRYVFIEHGLSDERRTARWQQRLDPSWHRLSGGCHLDRRIDEIVRGAGFQMAALERFQIAGPRMLGAMYAGVARPEVPT